MATYAPIKRTEVPMFYELLKPYGYTWVPSLVQTWHCVEILKGMEATRREIIDTPAPLSEIEKRLRASWERQLEANDRDGARFLLHTLNAEDPLARMRYLVEGDASGRQRLLSIVSWDTILRWLAKLPEVDPRFSEGGLSAAQRAKRLRELDQKIEKIKVELQAWNDPKYFLICNGQARQDIRKVFYVHWRDLQSFMCRPTGPRGIDLNQSPDDEKEAWQLLGLDKFVNPAKDLYPAPRAD